MNGRKDDQGKPPLSMIPRSALEAEARVMAYGAEKYGRDNWRGGFKWSRLIDATMRHIVAFADGEDNDPETGLSHLAHLRCCAGFLIEHVEAGLGEDDRHTQQQGAAVRDGARLVTLMMDCYSSATWPSHQCAPINEAARTLLRLPADRAFKAGMQVWAQPIDGNENQLDYVADFISAGGAT